MSLLNAIPVPVKLAWRKNNGVGSHADTPSGRESVNIFDIIESQKEKKAQPIARAATPCSKKGKVLDSNELVADLRSVGSPVPEFNNESEFSTSETKTADVEHQVENASNPKAKRGNVGLRK